MNVRMKILAAMAIAAMAMPLGACGSIEDGMGIRVFPPAPADKDVNNAAFLVDRGPYADDCWMYGWGCGPPGVATNIRVGGPYPNPAPVIYIADGRRYPSYGECRARHPASDCSRAALKP